MSNPIKWYGGKHYLAKKIIELQPPHLHYVEPYGGGLAVLFARDPDRDWYEGAPDYDGSAAMRGASEVVNDINGELITFWRVLQDQTAFQRMQRFLEAVPFSEDEWEDSVIDLALSPMPPEIDPGVAIRRAVGFFIRYRQSRQGLGSCFATLTRNRTRRGMNEQASAWLSAVEGLPEAHERLKRVVILNRDALDVIRQQDGERTHFYCDPPYLQETRTAKDAYEHEMTEDEHCDLINVLKNIKGTFQLSGYRSAVYDYWAVQYGWRRVDFKIDNKASGAKTKPQMVESLWMNYD